MERLGNKFKFHLSPEFAKPYCGRVLQPRLSLLPIKWACAHLSWCEGQQAIEVISKLQMVTCSQARKLF